MKKFLVFVLALSLIAGFAMAEDEGLGLTTILEFGIWDVNKPNVPNDDKTDLEPSDPAPYIMPGIAYGTSFLDGALDLYTELDYYIGLNKPNDEDKISQELYHDLFLGYNLSLTDSSTLSFLLENELDLIFAPEKEYYGIFRPGVCFNQNIESAGDFFAQIDLPIGYFDDWGESTTPVGLDFAVGWGSNFGLGLKAKMFFLLAPSDYDTGYTGIDLTASFEKGPVFGQVQVRIAKDKDGTSSFMDGSSLKAGVAIIPSIQYSFDMGLSIYANCAVGSIGSTGDVRVSPAIGATFSF